MPSEPTIGPRARALAESVSRAFANVAPRPVTREFAQQPWVQFQTDRTVGRALGPLVWREAPVRVLHGKTEVPTAVEPCARPLALGEAGQARGLGFRLEAGPVFDRLYLDNEKIVDELPPGAFHGGCVVDEKRLWIAWSTPARPADLLTIVLKDGSVRPLRDEARPSLGGLADLIATDEGGVLVARRKDGAGKPARGVVVFVEAAPQATPLGARSPALGARSPALGAYSPALRAFVEVGFVVVRRAETPEAEARVAALLPTLATGGTADASSIWTARLAAAPPAPPAQTLWIDPADPEISLARALTTLTPEAIGASSSGASASASVTAVGSAPAFPAPAGSAAPRQVDK